MKTKEILMIHCLALLGIALIASLFKKVPGIVKNGSFFIAIVLLAVSQVLDETNEPLIQKTDTNDPVLYTEDVAQNFTGAYESVYQPFYLGEDKKDSPGYGLRNDGGYCYPSTQSAWGDGNYNANPFFGISYKCGQADGSKIKNNNPTWDDKNKAWLRGGKVIAKPEKRGDLNWDKICMTPCCRSQIAYCCQNAGNFETCITQRGCNVDINGNSFSKAEIENIENNCSSAHN